MPRSRTGRRAAIAAAVLGVAVAAGAAFSFSGEIADRLYLWRNFRRLSSSVEASYVLVNSSVVPGARGFAGFSWYMVKFIVRRVSIRGTLDRPAAVKLLREKAGGRGF
jgi:hypothetical protein